MKHLRLYLIRPILQTVLLYICLCLVFLSPPFFGMLSLWCTRTPVQSRFAVVFLWSAAKYREFRISRKTYLRSLMPFISNINKAHEVTLALVKKECHLSQRGLTRAQPYTVQDHLHTHSLTHTTKEHEDICARNGRPKAFERTS